MKVLIIGRTQFLYNSALLISEKHNICGIITAPAAPEYSITEKDFEELANQIKCPFLIAKSSDEIIEFIKRTKPDIAISVNWVAIIGQEIIDLLPMGILNAHFGNLPAYRGNAVINWAILNNEPEIVLTIHYMESDKLDSGDILLQESFNLNKETTITDVLKFAEKELPIMFNKVLEGLENETIKPIKQSSRNITPFRCYPRIPEDSKIYWNRSASEINNLIKASTKPYSGAYSYIKHGNRIKKIYFWESRVIKENTDDIGIPGHIIKNDKQTNETYIYTGKGILAVKKAQFEGGTEFGPGSFFKSIRLKFGIDIEYELMNLQELLLAIKK